MIKDEDFILSNGVKIPKIGFGTWQIAEFDSAYTSTIYALKAGYRHIDSAYDYGNEKAIGKAIKDFGIERKNLFITTKLPSHIKTYDETKKYFYESLNSFGLDCRQGNIEAFNAMIELYNEGLIRAIGVSNFSISDIKNIVAATSFVPHVNQIRYFIGDTEKELTNYCQKNNILVEAYSPFATGKILDNKNILKVAEKYNTTVAKVCLAFCLQNNTVPLPKSTHEDRIISNLDINFKIDDEDMKYLNSL